MVSKIYDNCNLRQRQFCVAKDSRPALIESDRPWVLLHLNKSDPYILLPTPSQTLQVTNFSTKDTNWLMEIFAGPRINARRCNMLCSKRYVSTSLDNKLLNNLIIVRGMHTNVNSFIRETTTNDESCHKIDAFTIDVT